MENHDDGPLEEREVGGPSGSLGGDAQQPACRAAAGEGINLSVVECRRGRRLGRCLGRASCRRRRGTAKREKEGQEAEWGKEREERD